MAGAATAAAWQRVARFLADADGPQHGWRLHTEALRAALAAHRSTRPPPWLLRSFEVRGHLVAVTAPCLQTA